MTVLMDTELLAIHYEGVQTFQVNLNNYCVFIVKLFAHCCESRSLTLLLSYSLDYQKFNIKLS